MDKCAPGAAVAIDEGVNRLELGVGNGGLGHGRQCVVVDERTQVLEQPRNMIRWRRYERGSAGVEAAAADPVLHGSDLPGVLVQAGAGEKSLVDPEEAVDGDRFGGAERVDGPGHSVDVSENLVSGDVDVSLSGCTGSFGAEQASPPDDKTFDERRGHRLGPQKQSSQGLGVGERTCGGVERGDRSLGVGDVSSNRAVEPELAASERVRHVGFVLTSVAVLARETAVETGLPPASLNLAHGTSLFKETA